MGTGKPELPPEDLTIPLKIVVVGDGSVGKTMLLHSYKEKNFGGSEYFPQVIEAYSVTLKLNEKVNVILDIHDTNGQEDFKDIRMVAERDASAFIICYSCVSHDSLENVTKAWVPELKQIQGNDTKKPPPYILCGTKADLYLENDIDHIKVKLGTQVARSIRAAYHVRCSALLYGQGQGNQGDEGKGKVEEVFRKAVRASLEKSPHSRYIFDDPPTTPLPCCCVLV